METTNNRNTTDMITVKNNTPASLICGNFDSNSTAFGIPFDAETIPAGKTATLKTGNFPSVLVGLQVQSGGVYLNTPKSAPKVKKGDTLTISLDQITP